MSGSTHLIHFLFIDLNAYNIHTTFLCLDPVLNSLASELGHIAQEFPECHRKNIFTLHYVLSNRHRRFDMIISKHKLKQKNNNEGQPFPTNNSSEKLFYKFSVILYLF